MHRFFVNQEDVCDGIARLSPDDSRHACQVLRLDPGDEIVISYDGGLYTAQLESADLKAAVCRVLAPLPSPEPALRITLYQGLPKGDKMEYITQKCTEAGVATIVPVETARGVVKLQQKDKGKRQERWQRIAMEAAKQSGRACIPKVEAPISFKATLTAISRHQVSLVPWEEAAGLGTRGVHGAYPGVVDMAIFIGPEGGITEAEIDALKEAGALPITLGKRIFRTETAGLAAIISLFTLYGEME